MLAPAQYEEFRRSGLLRLPGAIPRADAAEITRRIWSFLSERHGIAQNDPSTWTVDRPAGFQSIRRSGTLERIASPGVCDALDDLLGSGCWNRHRRWGRLLVTFPWPAGRWDVPSKPWHNDFLPFRPGGDPRAVQMFALLNEVRPQGGGTLVLTGSHRLVAKYADGSDDGPHPKALRKQLASRHPFLRELWGREPSRPVEGSARERGRTVGGTGRMRRFMTEETVIDGVPLRVVELSGQPGDVFLMHCDTFHVAAPNCRTAPRMMATDVIGREPPRAARPSS